MTGHRTKLEGYKIDKSGKLQRSTKGKSISRRIAEKKKPKQRWRPAQ